MKANGGKITYSFAKPTNVLNAVQQKLPEASKENHICRLLNFMRNSRIS